MTYKKTQHPKFAGWCNELRYNAAPEANTLEQRWLAVNEIIQVATHEVIETLIQAVSQQQGKPVKRIVTGLITAIQKYDTLFDSSEDNDHELRVLAACCLATLMDGDTDSSALTALMVSASTLAGAKPLIGAINLSEQADKIVKRLSLTHRTRPTLIGIEIPKLSSSDVMDAYDEALQDSEDTSESAEGSTPDASANAIEKLADMTFSAITQLTQNVNTSMEKMNRYLKVQDEEVDMLWLLIGGRSHEFNLNFTDIPLGANSFLVAFELANTTTNLPGPESILSLFSRAGVALEQEMSIPEVIRSLNQGWIDLMIQGKTTSDLTLPLHNALSHYLTDTDNGLPYWAKQTGIDEKTQFPLAKLALQFYRECLISRAKRGELL
ncbi:GTPase-associated system all-helical protein GASH [Chromobacterium sp. Beijing]|uniref:GTPase-associated system all-helical protein GASH n=1 Tax=Chromobacterium sp. Beijing TaxID=2735795 RepID=UPI001F339C33|nr:GTPase-associated system all-helical protein GASH [Chromobacterium sp. Beijing]UJB33412.1 hypothetical protein HQN78_21490 [Chromobacterium sp. Beijing]